MVWHTLLQPTDFTLLARIPTTVDRIVVWSALALVIGLIAWREYTLPDVSPPTPAPHPNHHSDLQLSSQPGMAKLLSAGAPADPSLVTLEPRSTASPAEG